MTKGVQTSPLKTRKNLMELPQYAAFGEIIQAEQTKPCLLWVHSFLR